VCPQGASRRTVSNALFIYVGVWTRSSSSSRLYGEVERKEPEGEAKVQGLPKHSKKKRRWD